MKRKNKGFTLLEIIIVVIIVGVLASLALPRLFSTVEFSRSTEAMATIGSVRQAMERCMLRNGSGDYANCNEFKAAEIADIPDPANEPGVHFAYTFPSASTTKYSILATRNAVDGGAATSTITVTVDLTAKTITKAGATAFVNL